MFRSTIIIRWQTVVQYGLFIWSSFHNVVRDRIEITAPSIVASASSATKTCLLRRCLVMTVSSGSTMPAFSHHVIVRLILGFWSCTLGKCVPLGLQNMDTGLPGSLIAVTSRQTAVDWTYALGKF
jgi:hypothetical protein